MKYDDNIMISIAHQMNIIEKDMKNEIDAINKEADDVCLLFKEVMKLYEHYEKNGSKKYRAILPLYYVIKNKYRLAWILNIYLELNIATTSQAGYDRFRNELENPDYNILKPFTTKQLNERFQPKCPFDAGDNKYNDGVYYQKHEQECSRYSNSYDLSPESRYVDRGDDKEYNMHYSGIFEIFEILPLAFRQERYDDFKEMLFRIKCIISTGEVPKYITEGPKYRQIAPYVNMYDMWFRARFAKDELNRKELAQEALFWYVETVIRGYVSRNDVLDLFIDIFDLYELIGEFDLMEDQQDEFLGYFKKWTMYASISHFKKMQANPIKMMPFEERNAMTYDDFKALYDSKKKKKNK